MFVLRPIRESDLPKLVDLAQSIKGGLTTLPADSEFLGDRLADSLRAFSARVRKPGGEYYLFVLENTANGEIVGTSGIASRVGGFDPWYSYEIRTEKYTHAPLNIEKEIAVLNLKEEHRGPTEICSLFLRPDCRRGGNGRLLSLARFQFIGAFQRRFTDTIIAEMRGFTDASDRSPFWEAVGRHFFDFDFYRADFISGLGDKEFIADLMPDHPIYITLLPSEVQQVIGRVHRDTEPALALLLAEGFAPTNEVDIFDAGPQVKAKSDQIRTVRTMQAAKIQSAAARVPATAEQYLLSNGILDFRATVGGFLRHPDGTVSLSPEIAGALNLDVGDKVTFSPLR